MLHIREPYNQKRWNRKNCQKFFHNVIFEFWIQICNTNLCKSHIFWITANIEKWHCFTEGTWWSKSMKLEKLLDILLKGNFLRSEFKSATQIYENPIHFEIQLILRNDLVSHTKTWWLKSMKLGKLLEIRS